VNVRPSKYDQLILEAFQRLETRWHTPSEIAVKIQHSVPGDYSDWRSIKRITQRMAALATSGYLREYVR
jgi:hypothetical protein